MKYKEIFESEGGYRVCMGWWNNNPIIDMCPFFETKELAEKYVNTLDYTIPETKNPVTAIPADLKPGDRLGYKIIAVISGSGDWAAYAGLTDWSDDEVARHGDKINDGVAQNLFYAPVAAGLKYRR